MNWSLVMEIAGHSKVGVTPWAFWELKTIDFCPDDNAISIIVYCLVILFIRPKLQVLSFHPGLYAGEMHLQSWIG